MSLTFHIALVRPPLTIFPILDGVLRGQIEPMGCHADFQHFGLGKVVLVHVIEKLQTAGVEEIWVETDNDRQTAFNCISTWDLS